MFKWVALTSAIVFVVSIAGYVVSSQQPPPPTQQQTSENNKKEQAAENSDVALWDRWFPDSISIYTLFLVVFTGVLAVAGLYQLSSLNRAEHIAAQAANAAKQSADAARDAVNTMDKTAARQLRAYVYFDGPTSRPWPAVNPNRLSVLVFAVNGGHTWARNLTIQVGMVGQGPDDHADPFETVDWTKHSPHPGVLGPNQKIDLQFGDVRTEQFPLIHNGTLRLYFVGLIQYEDTVTSPSVIRKTHFSKQMFVDSEGGYSFGTTPTHNCADEDCPN